MKKEGTKILSIILVISLVFMITVNVSAQKRIKSTNVEINADKSTVMVGEIATLDAYMTPSNSTDKMKWKSSDNKVVTVNKYGVVTGIAKGKAKITVKTSSGKTSLCAVTVVNVNDMTEAQVKSLISKNTLSETQVKKLISDNTLSEEQVKSFIKDGTLSDDYIKSLIIDNTLSEDKIKSLIADNTLSEELVKKLIADNTISEDTVKSLIADNTLSEKQIKQLIADNTVSEETIKSLIKDNSLTEEDVKRLIVSADAQNWEDGTELTCYNASQLPIKCSDTPIASSDVTITSVSVKKYHCSDIVNGLMRKYKYVITINGTTAPGSLDIDNYSFFYYIKVFNQCSSNTIDGAFNNLKIDGNTFSSQYETYEIYEDYDTYLIPNYVGYDSRNW